MRSVQEIARRASIVTALTAAVLALAHVPSYAQDNLARVTVTDQPGAPEAMLRQLEQETNRSLGTLQTVMAVDAAGRELTANDVEALLAGRQVEGVRVVGSMVGSRDVLGTTMADLADGRFDGTPGEASPTTVLLFATDIPEGREWCLTMCVASGRSVLECILARLGTGAGPVPRWVSFELPGSTTLEGLRATAQRAAGVVLGELETLEVFTGERLLSAEEMESFREGEVVDALPLAARFDEPDPTWTLDDAEDNAGVSKKIRLSGTWGFYRIPILDIRFKILCVKADDGPWNCEISRRD